MSPSSQSRGGVSRQLESRELSTAPRLFLNTYFKGQRISGQQRYADEISKELFRQLPQVTELGPLSRWGGRKTAWPELLATLPHRARAGTLLSLTSRAPIRRDGHVVTIHDLFSLTHPEWYSPRYAACASALLKMQIRTAAAIVTVSQPTKNEVEELAPRDTPILVAPNAPSELSEGPCTDEARIVVPVGALVTVGSVEPRKNLGRLIEAYGRLRTSFRREHPLLVVGGVDHRVFAQASLGDIPSGCVFTGHVCDACLRAAYERAHVFVSVSLAEGFGIPVVEAAKYGNGRMLLSDIPSYRWITDDMACFVEPENVSDIAERLVDVATASSMSIGEGVAHKFQWATSAGVIAAQLTAHGA